MISRRCYLLPPIIVPNSTTTAIATSILLGLLLGVLRVGHTTSSNVLAFSSSSSHFFPQRQKRKSSSSSLSSVLHPRILLCDVPTNIIEDLKEQYNDRASLNVIQNWTDDELEIELCKQQHSYDAVIIRSANTISNQMIQAVVASSSSSSSDSSSSLSVLRVIGRAGVGIDNIDCVACQNAQIKVVTAAGANAIAVAEHTFALLFALARKIKPAANSVAKGKWMKPTLVGLGIRSKTLGIIGFGSIGYEVANIGSALGMNILIAPSSSITNDDDDDDDTKQQRQIRRQTKIDSIQGAKESSTLDELLQLSDFITIHLPLTDDTASFISHEEFKKMKSTGMLISVGRGGVVDEDALLMALQQESSDDDDDGTGGTGGIAGAALDVFVNEGSALNEDPILMALANLDSTVITPHLGGHTQEAQADVWSCVVKNVLNALENN